MKFLRKVKTRSVFITLCLLGVLVLIITVGERYQLKIIQNSVQYITTPVQKIVTLATSRITGTTMKFQGMSTLVDNNESLQKEVERLSYENTILEQYKIENEKLKKLLQLAQRYEQYPSEGANVIAKDPSNWYKIFTIDKGINAGFNVEDTILSGGGLVGHITEAGPLFAKVLAIIDDRSAVSATVLRTGDVGILKGDIELMQQGLCKLQIDIQSEVIKGDQIVTSHLSAVYPPGIMIGIVEDVMVSQNGLTQYAYVRPMVDFKHLEQVLVLKNKNTDKVQD